MDIRKYIHESNLIEGISDPAEIDQSLIAWRYLEDWNTSLNHGVICKIQKIITLNQTDLRPDQRGYYRSLSQTNVHVGNHVPPNWQLVNGMMDNWLLDYEELGPWMSHVRFERIHPFVDGNGRTGRMLYYWQLTKLGELDDSKIILAKKREKYYADLK